VFTRFAFLKAKIVPSIAKMRNAPSSYAFLGAFRCFIQFPPICVNFSRKKREKNTPILRALATFCVKSSQHRLSGRQFLANEMGSGSSIQPALLERPFALKSSGRTTFPSAMSAYGRRNLEEKNGKE
jgi:hypothetical protein